MNMFIFLLFAHAFSTNASSLFQNDFKIVVKGVKVESVNHENVECEVFMSKIDRYTAAANLFLQFKLDVPSHYKILFKCYEFLNNEYRPFAVHLERSLCSFLEIEYKNIFYPDFLRLGANMLKPKCPVLKGNYSVYNYIPSVGNLPAGLPFKNLLAEFKVLNGTNVEFNIHAYLFLDRDAAIRERYS